MTKEFTDEMDLSPYVSDSTVDMIRNLDSGIYSEASRRGVTPSAILDEADPSSEQPPELRGTDAFQRALLDLTDR